MKRIFNKLKWWLFFAPMIALINVVWYNQTLRFLTAKDDYYVLLGVVSFQFQALAAIILLRIIYKQIKN